MAAPPEETGAESGPGKVKKIPLGTFRKWNVADIFDIKKETVDGATYVVKLMCKMCTKHVRKIERDDKMKGVAKAQIRAYVEGTSYLTKHNVNRHITGKAHTIALEYERLLERDHVSSTTASSASCSGASSSFQPHQPRIDDMIHRNAREAYRKLLKSAYELALAGQPLENFKTLVKVQKQNGVKLIDGTDSSKTCREFISEIADAIREKVAILLCSSVAFSVLTDGSQPRKTQSEKELVLVRVVKCGLSVYYVIALQDIDDFGDANAQNLKTSIDQAFTQKLKMPEERYLKLLVGATSDGAAVNTGIYSGVLTRFKTERQWLITVHCVSHRLELALKSSLLKVKEFKAVTDFMVGLYYVMKNSGKLKRELKDMGQILSFTVYNLPKVHGTRFIAHHRRGLEVLLNNWVPCAQMLESVIEQRSHRNIEAKLQGYLKKFKDFSFLSTVCLFKACVDSVTPLSLQFEKNMFFVFDVEYSVAKTINKVKSLLEDTYSDNHACLLGSALPIVMRFDDESKCLKSKGPKPGHNRRKPENREYTELDLDDMRCPGGIDVIGRKLEKMRDTIVPDVVNCIETRFQSFDLSNHNDVIKSMQWLDPANWLQHDTNSEVDAILAVALHFEDTLKASGFNFERKVIKNEWSDLKLAQKNYYTQCDAVELWQKILTFRRSQFKNVSMVAEVVMTLGPSNSFVEAGFSILNSQLSDRRLNLSHSTMENCLMIKANNRVFTEKEKNEILDTALDKHMSKRRKLTLEGGESKSAESQLPATTSAESQSEPPAKKRRLTEIGESDDESDSDCSIEEEPYDDSEFVL